MLNDLTSDAPMMRIDFYVSGPIILAIAFKKVPLVQLLLSLVTSCRCPFKAGEKS